MKLLQAWMLPLRGTGRISSLDGLRGLGTTVLVATHAMPEILPGGPFLIGMFFTLSGFIITYLLLEGHYGTPPQPTLFWAQRIRRLLPPLVAMLLGTAVVLRLLGSQEQWLVWRTDIVAAAAQFYNWHLISGDSHDRAFLDVAWPTVHLWSLSLEEQFYFVWPLLFLIPLFVRRMMPFLFALAAVSLAWSAALFLMGASAERIMWGTDTRLMQIAVGAVGAVIVVRWSRLFAQDNNARRPWWARLGLIIPAAMIAVSFLPVEFTPLAVVLVPLPVAIVSALTLIDLSTRTGTPVDKIASWRPLVFLGVISYAIYLWHIPVLWIWRQLEASGAVGIAPVPRFLVVFAVSVLLAMLSWMFVESPTLLVNPKRKVPRRVLLAAGVPALAVTAVLGWWILSPTPQMQQQIDAAQTWDCPPGSPLCVMTDRGQPYAWACPEAGVPCLLYRPESQPSARVLIGGDSVSQGLLPGVVDKARLAGWEVWAVTKGCAHAQGRKWWWTTGADPVESIYGAPLFREQRLPFECGSWEDGLRSYLAQVDPDVYVAAATGVSEAMTFDGSDNPIPWFDPDFTLQSASAARTTIDVASEYDTAVVFVLPPRPVTPARCDTSAFVLGCAPAYFSSGTGYAFDAFSLGVRRALAGVASSRAAAADLDALVCGQLDRCPVSHSGVTWRPDGSHFTFTSGLLASEPINQAIEKVLRSRPDVR